MISPNSRSPRTRLPADQRRIQIVEVAKHLFAEGGLENITMRAMARVLGITPAAIYQHFPDKEAILAQIARDYFDSFIITLSAAKQLPEPRLNQFRAGLKAAIEHGLARPVEYRLVFMTPILNLGMSHRLPPDHVGEIPVMNGVEAFGILHDVVLDLVEQGLILPGDPNLLAESIWASLHGLICLLITHQSFHFTEKSKLINSQVELIIRGLGADMSFLSN